MMNIWASGDCIELSTRLVSVIGWYAVLNECRRMQLAGSSAAFMHAIEECCVCLQEEGEHLQSAGLYEEDDVEDEGEDEADEEEQQEQQQQQAQGSSASSSSQAGADGGGDLREMLGWQVLDRAPILEMAQRLLEEQAAREEQEGQQGRADSGAGASTSKAALALVDGVHFNSTGSRPAKKLAGECHGMGRTAACTDVFIVAGSMRVPRLCSTCC